MSIDVPEIIRHVRAVQAATGEGIRASKKALELHGYSEGAAIEHLRCAGQAVVRAPGARLPCGCVARGTCADE